jgi:hypothetical protein
LPCLSADQCRRTTTLTDGYLIGPRLAKSKQENNRQDGLVIISVKSPKYNCYWALLGNKSRISRKHWNKPSHITCAARRAHVRQPVCLAYSSRSVTATFTPQILPSVAFFLCTEIKRFGLLQQLGQDNNCR